MASFMASSRSAPTSAMMENALRVGSARVSTQDPDLTWPPERGEPSCRPRGIP